MRRVACLALLLLCAGCATRPAADASIPDFARRPYEGFSRRAALVVATSEWHAFGDPVVDGSEPVAPRPEDKPERQDGLWQRVGLYWWIGLDGTQQEHRWTGKHDANGVVFPAADDGDFAWSAAFISYVMRLAGAGDRFPYSASHAVYIDAAREASLGRRKGLAVLARSPADYAPVTGDLICFGRAGARGLRFEDLPAGRFLSHCAIVVATAPGSVSAIGGNVADSVALTHVPVTGQGKLAGPDGTILDQRYSWFVVLQVLYDR